MNLVKWFRKNNTKVMAVVVIVLMVGFVGGTALTQLLRGSGGMNSTIATYGLKKHRITPNDRTRARQELEILQALGAGQILQYQDLRGVLLGELLFSESGGSAELFNGLRQHIQQNRYFVSDKQLKAMYEERTVPTDIYWILLRDEAHDAGFHVLSEDIGQMLGQVIPRLREGFTYAQVMQMLVNRYGMTEAQILGTFAKLWAVLQYAEATCSLESVTNSEIRHVAGFENQTLTTECVQLKASYFADKSATPSPADLTAQFDQYKAFSPGQASEANPYGFGYKLPDRVQLECLALDLTEVATTVEKPTSEETETYYQQNREDLFTQTVKADPNDPNSPDVDKIQSYTEVVGTIVNRLTREKIVRKAEQILLEARNRADEGLEAVGSNEETKPTLAELKDQAGDYEAIATNLSQQRNVTVYYSRTGLLSAADVQGDEHLGRLFLTGYGNNPIRLSQLLFSIEELGDNAVTLMFVPKAEMYQSIGPLRNPSVERMPTLDGQIMAVVRIVAAEPAAEPANVDVTFSTKTLTLGEPDTDDSDDVHSVREQVVEDWRIVQAWDTTRTRAQELIELATQESWEAAIDKFNELYGAQAKSDPNDPNVFELQDLAGLQKIPSEQMDFIATQAANSPGASMFLNQLTTEQRLVSRLYSLIPPGNDTATKVPLVMEFKPEQSCYCLKSLSIERVNQQQFQSMKPTLLLRTEHVTAQSLSAVHFNPTNILKRTRFEAVEQDEAESDAEPNESAKDAT